MQRYKPVVLIVKDGWGLRETEHGNAVVQAHTPNFDRWLRKYERSILDASGEAVGLQKGQMGNSEVGHLNLGAGFIVYQDITLIDGTIDDGSFFKHATLVESFNKVRQNKKELHLIGLLGPGGIHSHTRHLFELIKLANQCGIKPVIHVITDGRDTPPNSGIGFVKELEAYLVDNPGTITTVSGRYYTMDRDKRWDRTQQGYDTLVLRQGKTASSASQAVAQSYEEGITDEFIIPTVKIGRAHV